jgi:hypothetical protein
LDLSVSVCGKINIFRILWVSLMSSINFIDVQQPTSGTEPVFCNFLVLLLHK